MLCSGQKRLFIYLYLPWVIHHCSLIGFVVCDRDESSFLVLLAERLGGEGLGVMVCDTGLLGGYEVDDGYAWWERWAGREGVVDGCVLSLARGSYQ